MYISGEEKKSFQWFSIVVSSRKRNQSKHNLYSGQKSLCSLYSMALDKDMNPSLIPVMDKIVVQPGLATSLEDLIQNWLKQHGTSQSLTRSYDNRELANIKEKENVKSHDHGT